MVLLLIVYLDCFRVYYCFFGFGELIFVMSLEEG